jgi:hypothetical protein
MQYAFRLTGGQHAQLQRHLFPGDGLEAAAFILCGRMNGADRHAFCGRRVVLIPHKDCKRTAVSVDWPTKVAGELIEEAMKRKMAIVKIHSHPGGYEAFSERDDQADKSFFGSVCNLLEDGMPHASAVMLPGDDGRIFARAIMPDGNKQPVELVAVAGDGIQLWHAEGGGFGLPEFVRRHAQAFGAGTVERLRRMTVVVVGCSGTGSPLIEQLVRLGGGCIILIDPDRVEWKNLNRINMTTAADANLGRFKVDVLAEAIGRMGLGTRVMPLAMNLENPKAIRATASADLVIGCVDSWYGRDLLNRVASFYVLPYIDLGVELTALPQGGIDQVWGAVHYVQPGGSSLKSRAAYTSEHVRAELMKRDDPQEYKRRLAAKYIRGVQEDRPAVISVNTLVASLAVNELLARIHRYRVPPDSDFAAQRIGLHEGDWIRDPESKFPPCSVLGKEVGRGDVVPLLDKPELSEMEGSA